MEAYLHHKDRVLTHRDYCDALRSQDAPNLCGIAQTFAEVLKKLLGEKEGGEWTFRHPIVTLYLTQMAHLNGHMLDTGDAYNQAAAVCEKRSKEVSIKTEKIDGLTAHFFCYNCGETEWRLSLLSEVGEPWQDEAGRVIRELQLDLVTTDTKSKPYVITIPRREVTWCDPNELPSILGEEVPRG